MKFVPPVTNILGKQYYYVAFERKYLATNAAMWFTSKEVINEQRIVMNGDCSNLGNFENGIYMHAVCCCA